MNTEPHWLTEEEMAIVPDTPHNVNPESILNWNGNWYFYDETYSRLHGPYPMKEGAQKAQEEYESTL